MTARIFKPARNAMQSGVAKTKRWVLEHDQVEARRVEPLMGWTSSADMRQQVRLFFDPKEAAIAYATREGLPFRVEEPKVKTPKTAAYSDNFRAGLSDPWTH